MSYLSRKYTSRIMLVCALCALASSAADKPMQKLVFGEREIAGRIRRPQLVMISADQRPVFEPMMMTASKPVPGDHSTAIVTAEPDFAPFKIDETGINGVRP